MPRTARASDLAYPHLFQDAPPTSAESPTGLARAEGLTLADQAFLLRLQRQALEYFLDNQVDNGLVLDRQRNFGPRRAHGVCSTAATGMGFIALALASAPPHRLLTRGGAAQRIRAGLETALERLPHDEGVVPHFIDSRTGAVWGIDHFSTVETSWLVAGALWAAAFLHDATLEGLAARLYDRVHWQYWTDPESSVADGLLRHGKRADGQFLGGYWDRLNGETVGMYVLAAGAAAERAVDANAWAALQPRYGTAGGLRFNNADLGLFVFQYGLDLLDLWRWQAPGGAIDLMAEAGIATVANQRACRDLALRFATYRRYWGLSAGDGPGHAPDNDSYQAYAPAGPVDGTAHITATLASVGHAPVAALENLYQAQFDRQGALRGRYGFSNVNLDRTWIGRDMVGIDVGAAALALDNYLANDRIRRFFHEVPFVRRGLHHLGFTDAGAHHSEKEQEQQLARRAA